MDFRLALRGEIDLAGQEATIRSFFTSASV